MSSRGGAPRGVALALALFVAGCGGQARIDEAQAQVDRAPKKAENWIELARALDAAGKEEEAMYAFSAAFDRQSKDVAAYRRAAELAGNFGRFREARTFADLGLWAQKDDPKCLELAARALLSSGTPRDKDRAKKYLDKLGRDSVPLFWVSRDRLLLAKLRATSTTKNFEVRTDAGGAYARDIGVVAQRIFDRYYQLLPGLREPPTRMRLFVFERREDYVELCQKHADRFSESEALTILDPAGIRVIFSHEPTVGEGVIGGAEWMDRLLLHELTHVCLYLGSRARAPLWMQEGLAEYFSGAEPVNASFPVGGILPGRVREMRLLERVGISLPSLATLFYGYGAERGLYSHAWSFMHFLAEGRAGRYRDRFEKMLGLAATGRADSAFDEAFAGVDRGALEREWHEYASTL